MGVKTYERDGEGTPGEDTPVCACGEPMPCQVCTYKKDAPTPQPDSVEQEQRQQRALDALNATPPCCRAATAAERERAAKLAQSMYAHTGNEIAAAIREGE